MCFVIYSAAYFVKFEPAHLIFDTALCRQRLDPSNEIHVLCTPNLMWHKILCSDQLFGRPQRWLHRAVSNIKLVGPNLTKYDTDTISIPWVSIHGIGRKSANRANSRFSFACGIFLLILLKQIASAAIAFCDSLGYKTKPFL